PLPRRPGTRGPGPISPERPMRVPLRDLEANFRRELATRVQLQGLGDLIAFAVPAREPDKPFRTLLQYLGRALNEPHLWMALKRGNPPEFVLWRTGPEGEPETRTGRVSLPTMDPEWLRWLALGEGEPILTADPWGERRGGPWHPIAIRGEVPEERLGGSPASCPGAAVEGKSCVVTGAPLRA